MEMNKIKKSPGQEIFFILMRKLVTMLIKVLVFWLSAQRL